MAKGRFRVGFSMIGSFLRTSHTVDPGQQEPGLSADQQPAEHALDIGLLEWDLDMQLGVHERFAFELMLPIRTTLIDATFRDEDGELLDVQSIHHRDETIAGVGDLVIGGRIGLVLPTDVKRWTLALRTGASLPTGNIEPDPFALGDEGREHQHMFFGSGTVDPLIGLDTNIAFDQWALVGWTAAKIPLYANRYGYQGSKVVISGVGAMSGFGLKRWSFLLQPEIYFETPATWNGSAARNSGRISLIAGGGAFFQPTPAWQVHALLKIPYYTWAQGGQLRWPFVAMLGFSYVWDALGRG